MSLPELRLGLRWRLLLIVLMATAPVFGLILHLGWVQRQLDRKSVRDGVEMAAWRVQGQIMAARQLLVALAQLPTVRQLDEENTEHVLTRVLHESLDYTNLGLIDADGWLVASGLPMRRTLSFSDRSFFRNAMITRGMSIGEYETGRLSGVPSLHLGHAVLSPSGEPVGVIYASLDVLRMRSLTEDLTLPPGASLLLLDRRWNVLADWPTDDFGLGRNLADLLLRRWVDAKASTFVTLDGSREWLWSVVPVTQPDGSIFAYACVRVDRHTAWDGAARSVRRNLVLGVGAMLLMLLLASWASGRMILRHVEDLGRSAKRLAEGDWTARPRLDSSTREIAALAKAFDHMADSLSRQHEAILDANQALEARSRALQAANRELEDLSVISSHDLQEPLRKIRAFCEKLVRYHAGALDTEGRDTVERIVASSNSMASLVEDLLAYSQISAHPWNPVELDLGEVVAEILMEYRTSFADIGAVAEVGKLPRAKADVVLMRRLLSHLMDNAIKFRKPTTPLRIVIDGRLGQDDRGREFVEIRFEDNGIGFDEAHARLLFQLFRRLQPRTRYDGTGVGLAICRRIAERHGGTITAFGSPGRGAAFLIHLPQSPSVSRTENDPRGNPSQGLPGGENSG